MPKTDQELSLNEQRALEALLSTGTVEEAAKQANLSDRTLYRYLSKAEFNQALQEQHDAILSNITTALLNLCTKALVVLGIVLDDETASPATRTRAALGVLERAQRMAELNELSQRLVLLEQTVLEVRR